MDWMDFKFIKRMANIARQDGKMKTITLQVEDMVGGFIIFGMVIASFIMFV